MEVHLLGAAMAEDKKVTLSGAPADPTSHGTGAPQPIDPKTGMHKDYYVLSDSERAKGHVRPVRDTYKHEKCGSTTRMNITIAETYARDPKFYGSTFCYHCGGHFPVGPAGEFVWLNGEKVGS